MCQSLGWDDLVPEMYVKQWEKWVASLIHIPNVTIPCWFDNLTSKSQVELHIFCDVLVYGYEALLYILVKPQNTVSLILVKSQVISHKKRL